MVVAVKKPGFDEQQVGEPHLKPLTVGGCDSRGNVPTWSRAGRRFPPPKNVQNASILTLVSHFNPPCCPRVAPVYLFNGCISACPHIRPFSPPVNY